MSNLVFRRALGRCANGYERDKGRLVHAVENINGSLFALCGYAPGILSAGWSDPLDAASCPRCLRKMAREP